MFPLYEQCLWVPLWCSQEAHPISVAWPSDLPRNPGTNLSEQWATDATGLTDCCVVVIRDASFELHGRIVSTDLTGDSFSTTQQLWIKWPLNWVWHPQVWRPALHYGYLNLTIYHCNKRSTSIPWEFGGRVIYWEGHWRMWYNVVKMACLVSTKWHALLAPKVGRMILCTLSSVTWLAEQKAFWFVEPHLLQCLHQENRLLPTNHNIKQQRTTCLPRPPRKFIPDAISESGIL